jgi:hypothetical protein
MGKELGSGSCVEAGCNIIGVERWVMLNVSVGFGVVKVAL